MEPTKSEATTGRSAPLILHAQPVAGQQLMVPVSQVLALQPQQDVETGRFHDGVCDFAAEGCSPCCHALCCPCFSFANTVSTIKANVFGLGSSWKTNLIVFVLLMGIRNWCQNQAQNHLFQNVDFTANFNQTFWQQVDENQNDWQYKLPSAIAMWCGLLVLLLVTCLRKQFRLKFRIPGDDCNDCCCAMWCSPCVLSQMDRHLGTSRTRGCVFSDPAPAQAIPQMVTGTIVQQPFTQPVVQASDVTLV